MSNPARISVAVTYRGEHEDCNVPKGWSENEKLAKWVQAQRKAKKQGKISENHVERLEAIGFVWDPYEARWEEMFAELQDYLARHRNCCVPTNWPENPQLSTWVQTQRKAKKQGKISDERVARLEAINFVWRPLEEKQADARVVAKASGR